MSHFRSVEHCFLVFGALALLCLHSGAAADTGKNDEPLKSRIANLEKEFENLRTALKIPGMSAAVVKDQKVIWSHGFGLADREGNIPATPDTRYRIASLTKTFASTLLMQLVESGKLDLNDSMTKYASEAPSDAIKVRHIFSHTSSGVPGTRYSYDGNRFASLDAVIQKAAGKPFRELVVEKILEPLKMSDSVPGQDVLDQAGFISRLTPETVQRYRESLKRLAIPYTLYGKDELVRSGYPNRSISASAGMISTVMDLAKFDTALDRHEFIRNETLQLAWTPTQSNEGKALPYGLGWFVQEAAGAKLVWHYGLWPTFSALILKIPERQATLIVLANNDGLSAPFGLGAGNILNSPFALAFLRLFLFPERNDGKLAELDWHRSPDQFREQLSQWEPGSNGYSYRLERSAHGRIQQYLDGRAARVRPEIRVDADALKAFVGRYRQSADLTVTVGLEGDRLTYQRSYERNGRQFPFDRETLFAESPTQFFDKTSNIGVRFVKDDSGKVTHLVLRLGESEQTVPRVP